MQTSTSEDVKLYLRSQYTVVKLKAINGYRRHTVAQTFSLVKKTNYFLPIKSITLIYVQSTLNKNNNFIERYIYF